MQFSPVTLPDMLDARERRALRQQALLERHHQVLCCFTLNIAGPVKNSDLILRAFRQGCRMLETQFLKARVAVSDHAFFEENTGNEGYYVLDSDVRTVKALTLELEEGTALGRLFDIDILSPDGRKAERSDFGLPVRPCLICGRPVSECARSRSHSVPELQEKTQTVLSEALDALDRETIVCHAVRALLTEVCITPKPGLVDRKDSGSHRDMDIFTFMDSTASLYPYFSRCVRIGQTHRGRPLGALLPRLRLPGKLAESTMLSVTKGVNTHKGAIFTLGILCAAAGYADADKRKIPEYLLGLCREICAGLTQRDLGGITESTAMTAGQRLYAAYGITGIRGQAENGLPAVLDAGLPVLEDGLKQGKTLDEAGTAALLAILCSSEDTNLIARSDPETYRKVIGSLRALLDRDPYPDEETLSDLNRTFVSMNLSPGGSADLLVVCCFLHFLKEDRLCPM